MSRHCYFSILALLVGLFPQLADAQGWSEPRVLAGWRNIIWELSPLARAPDNTLHLVWLEATYQQPCGGALYYMSVKEGHASTPLLLTLAPDSGEIRYPTIAVGPDTIPHVVWVEIHNFPEYSIFTLLHSSLSSQNLVDTVYSVSTLYSVIRRPTVAITQDNTIYICWDAMFELWWTCKTEEGWISPRHMFFYFSSTKGSSFYPNLFTGPQDTVHLAFTISYTIPRKPLVPFYGATRLRSMEISKQQVITLESWSMTGTCVMFCGIKTLPLVPLASL